MAWKWKLIVEECTGCGICRDVCDSGAIEMSRWMAYPEPIEGECIGCLLCIDECPFDAVEVKEAGIETGTA